MALVDLGASVSLVCPKSQGNASTLISSIEKFMYPKIKGITYGLPILPPLLILFEALKARANIYHIHDFRMFAVAIFLKLFGKRVIYEIGDDDPSLIAHGFASRMPRQAMSFTRIIELIIRGFEKSCLRFFNCTVTITDHLRKDRMQCAKNIFVLGHYPFSYTSPMKMKKKYLDDLFGENSIVYVGSISKAKGINEGLWQILKMVSKDIPDIKLIIIGSGTSKYIKKIIQSARKYGIRENIVFLGPVAYPELVGLLNRAKLGLVLLTPMCYSYSIGLPLKMLDMMACEVPIIVQKGMLEAERIVKKSSCGVIVDSKDHDCTARTILHILKEDEYRQQLGKNGLSYVKTSLSRSQLIDKIGEIYEEI